MPETTIALKEWAAAIEALRTGRQILIMRKGGIREETKDFQVESDSFYLYPTYEHQKQELFKPEFRQWTEETLEGWSSQHSEVAVSCYAELAADILVETQEQLNKLSALHVWTDSFAEERLKWKKTQPLHVMLLKVHKLDKPVSITIQPEYTGCKSWIGLPAEAFETAAKTPVMTERAFAAAVSRVIEALQ
ncbi:DUF1802 family protein [Paenibacillus allorhizosphaerae]|uniref:DUF1802 family protein n=1 Tax=Paenibacillus allorhizosphaerae TaxID=2849866 RepID=A0ABN7TI66_9BACL|nr:DUF1802 family protein [Paenibacillus allorhizosphaerae]CAG7631412.1 hypothetical protein PAECIP111802_01741 [Paenibacillus allorhizosphaerae]